MRSKSRLNGESPYQRRVRQRCIFIDDEAGCSDPDSTSEREDDDQYSDDYALVPPTNYNSLGSIDLTGDETASIRGAEPIIELGARSVANTQRTVRAVDDHDSSVHKSNANSSAIINERRPVAVSLGRRERAAGSRSSTKWCWTRFVSDSDIEAIKSGAGIKPIDHASVRYTVWQLERCPNTQRYHLQGFTLLGDKTTLGEFKKRIFGAVDDPVHCEQSKGDIDSNHKYCTKEESRVAGPWEHGTRPRSGQGARNDLQEAIDLVRAKGIAAAAEVHAVTFVRMHRGLSAYDNIMQRKWKKPWITKIHILCGVAGAGKTTRAMNSYPGHVYTKDNNNKWWDGYDPRYHRAVVINEYHEGDYLSMDKLKSLADAVLNPIEVKGGITYFMATDLFITTNETSPAMWFRKEYKDQDWQAFWRRVYTFAVYTGLNAYTENANTMHSQHNVQVLDNDQLTLHENAINEFFSN